MALVVIIAAVVLLGKVMAIVVGQSVRDFSSDLPSYEAKLRGNVGVAIAWLEARGLEIVSIRSSKWLDVSAAMRLTAATLNGFSGLLANGLLILMAVIFMLLEASSFLAQVATIAGGRPDGTARFEDFFHSINR
jgi:predicted PurR-regulated permease PerM